DGRAVDLDLGDRLAGGLGGLSRLELLLELFVEQLLLEVLGDLELVDAEVGRAVVELDLGVLGGARGLLVGGEKRVLERVHQGVGGNSLLLLEHFDGIHDFLGHALTPSFDSRFERRTAVRGIETGPSPESTLTCCSSASVSSPVKLLCPEMSSVVFTRTRLPMKRRKCSGLVSGRSGPGEQASSDQLSSRSRSDPVTRSQRARSTPSGRSITRRRRSAAGRSSAISSTSGSES